MAYAGSPILLEDLLFNAQHNLIDQSMSSRSRETPTNGDGFGVGWYGLREQPGLFRSIRPAWNDFNLRDLAAQIESRMFFAHVRATSLATIQETNCHPFRYRNWLFVHNGEIDGMEHLRRDLLLKVGEEYFNNVLGTTDSELMFHLALTFGLERDAPLALARMAAFVEDTARQHGIDESVWMTLGVSDGHRVWAVRYASDGNAPTLFYSRELEHLIAINPALEGRFQPGSRAIVSEPIGRFADMWVPVPPGTLLEVDGPDLRIRPFRPMA
ncbi:MAG TPA: class II glutamine amidotransferase [Candidatus Krumholzibacteria bacterium]|nr:class II glutamine amidotransferase [Candidatus Krumholzibacteria bacterium]